MVDMRWKEEREEIVELIYRIQADHDGSLRETEAQAFGPWAMEAIKRARKIRWLASKGAPPGPEYHQQGLQSPRRGARKSRDRSYRTTLVRRLDCLRLLGDRACVASAVL